MLRDKPILVHTIQAFLDYKPEVSIVLVLSKKEWGRWENIKQKYFDEVDIKLAAGGNTRFQSVRNGLEKVGESGIVSIHDAVRPLVSQEIIRSSFDVASSKKAVVAAVPLKESIRAVFENQTRAADRSAFRMVQTPQTFDLALLREAYDTQELSTFTDDASVVESTGEKVHIIQGSYANIKITTPEDLVIAEALFDSL